MIKFAVRFLAGIEYFWRRSSLRLRDTGTLAYAHQVKHRTGDATE